MIMFYQNGWLNHQLVDELLAISSFWSLTDGEYGDPWFGKNMKHTFATQTLNVNMYLQTFSL